MNTNTDIDILTRLYKLRSGFYGVQRAALVARDGETAMRLCVAISLVTVAIDARTRVMHGEAG